MAFDRERPYNDLPLLPPDASHYESIQIYKALAEARASLAELKGRIPVIPNPFMLINTLVLQEARDSSLIENIETSTDYLFKAFSSSSKNIDPNTKEVLRYRTALWDSFNKLKSNTDFNKDFIIEIFKTVTNLDKEIRTVQVRIGNEFYTVYTPPQAGEVLNKKLKNWLDFSNTSNDIDPLIKMAILHYQFESIHPFNDGNGRTGRILNILYLSKIKLLDLPVLYLSKYILEHKTEYNRLLKEVTENHNWKDWVLFILEGISQTSKFTLGKINAIYDLFIKTIEKVKIEAKDIYSYELVELIFSQTDCRISMLEDKGIASRNTASKYLKRLQELDILEMEKVGTEYLYRNIELYKILVQA